MQNKDITEQINKLNEYHFKYIRVSDGIAFDDFHHTFDEVCKMAENCLKNGDRCKIGVYNGKIDTVNGIFMYDWLDVQDYVDYTQFVYDYCGGVNYE